MVHTLIFEPNDVLLFRDHRPFDAGLHTNASSVFPPPSTFYGALRTALIERAGGRFDRWDFGLQGALLAAVGTKKEVGTLQLHGPVLAKLGDGEGDVRPILPAPRDLGLRVVSFADEKVPNAARPRAWTRRDDVGLPPTVLLPREPKAHKEERSDWLAHGHASQWLAGRLEGPSSQNVEGPEPMVAEVRVGIQRNHATRAATNGMFYTASRWRLQQGVVFAVEVEVGDDADLDDAIRGLEGARIPLGGKGHRARIRVRADAPLFEEAVNADQVRLWLISPLLIEHDAGLDPFLDHVVAITTDRGQPAGGFDLALRRPKPLVRTLPAGTVIYTDLDLAALDRWRRGARIHLGSEESARAGWGLALPGASPTEKG